MADIEEPAPFGTQQPLVPVRRESIDVSRFHVYRKRPQTLNRIHHEKTTFAMADLPEITKVYTVSAQVLDEADRQHPRSTNSFFDASQIVEYREPLDLDSNSLQSFPGEVIGGKLLMERHHDIAGFPLDSSRNGRDTL